MKRLATKRIEEVKTKPVILSFTIKDGETIRFKAVETYIAKMAK